MTTKVVKNLKYSIVLLFIFSAIFSCKEEEIENIGVDLINNNTFSTNSETFDVTSENVNIERIQGNIQSQFLLGTYSDEEFGDLRASFVSQVSLPSLDSVYGNSYDNLDDDLARELTIDEVLLTIPYESTLDSTENGIKYWTIDNVVGDTLTNFKLDVYELGTFLNTLSPDDPSQNAVYYTDKMFQKEPTSLYSGDFKVNSRDTVTYINRHLANGTAYKEDTIKVNNVQPFIHLKLNKDFFKERFVDNPYNDEFETLENFSHYFRGIYVEASQSSSKNSHIVSLDLSNAKISLYYSLNKEEGENQDLDENGTSGEESVRINRVNEFMLSGIQSSIYERDYTNSKKSGIDRLYVQGASGEEETFELLSNEEIEQIKENNWLITDATLTFYVDQSASTGLNIIPEQLVLYNYDEKEHLIDIFSEAGLYGGNLEYEVDDEDENILHPYKYQFKITDFISNLIEDSESARIGLKVYNSSDAPTSNVINDYSWTPKGVVLHGPNSEKTDKRLQLEIKYTKLNE